MPSSKALALIFLKCAALPIGIACKTVIVAVFKGFWVRLRGRGLNMRRLKYALAMMTWLVSVATPVLAAEPVPRSILILDESAGAAAGPFYAGIVAALRASVNSDPSRQASIFVEHLDLSRFRDAAYQDTLIAFLENKYRGKPIGVIVAVGDGALNYTLRLQSESWTQTPVVFTMVDTGAASGVKLPANVTGTTFRLKLSQMVEAAKAVVPNLQSVAIVGDAFEHLVPYRHLQHELPAIAAAGIQITDLTAMPLRYVRRRVADLPARSAIIYTVMYSDGEGTYLAPVEALRRFADAATRPIIVTTESQIGAGGTGGFVVVSSALGQHAASLVMRIFEGESVSTIPITEGNAVRPVFDWRQLDRWNVGESQLPPNSDIRFRQPSAWDQYRWHIGAIAAAVLVQFMLIHWLLYERRRRQQSEAVARNTLFELAHINRVATGSELTASIAHEVMQPLTGMVSSANAGLRWLSGEKPDVDKVRAVLSQIVAAGHRTAEVVRAIRAVFKRETVNYQPVEMNRLILEVLDLVKGDLLEHGVSVEMRLNESLPTIVGDPIQLQQVVLNLVINAIDAMSSLSGEARAVRVRTDIEEGGIGISVEDTGPGVTPEILDQMFKPLFSTKTQGMGLGLAICRSIVEAHHGTISAAHHQPHGLIVKLYLPVNHPGG